MYTFEEANAMVKEQIEPYLQSVCGIANPRKLFHCLNPAHNDQKPSMAYYAKRRIVHCFACGCNLDLFDLIRIETGWEGRQLFARTYERYGLAVIGYQEKTQGKKHTFYLSPKEAALIGLKLPSGSLLPCQKRIEGITWKTFLSEEWMRKLVMTRCKDILASYDASKAERFQLLTDSFLELCQEYPEKEPAELQQIAQQSMQTQQKEIEEIRFLLKKASYR